MDSEDEIPLIKRKQVQSVQQNTVNKDQIKQPVRTGSQVPAQKQQEIKNIQRHQDQYQQQKKQNLQSVDLLKTKDGVHQVKPQNNNNKQNSIQNNQINQAQNLERIQKENKQKQQIQIKREEIKTQMPNGVKQESSISKSIKYEESISPSQKSIVKQEVKKTKEKVRYDMPGQTKETPLENDSLRKFYSSCLQQKPSSQMSKRWLLQHGLLPYDEALDFYQEIQNGKLSQKGKPMISKFKQETPQKRKPSETKPQIKNESRQPQKQQQISKPKVQAQLKREFFDEDSDDEPIIKRIKKN